MNYLDKYSIAESIEDETTLSIHHTMAPSEMTVPAERLDQKFFALAELEGVTDVDELNKVLDQTVGLRTFLTADDRIVYGRFLEPEQRKEFFEAYKELEALWEILSPSPALRDHIETFRRLARLYETVRNAYASGTNYTVDLANKTRLLVQESVTQEGLGRLTKTVTFDVSTLKRLQSEPGLEEAKAFNLVRGLRQEIESNPDKESVLLPL